MAAAFRRWNAAGRRQAADRPVQIVALGDSLTAGLRPAGQRGLSGQARKGAEGQRASRSRSPMPAFPATPPRAGSPGSTGRCRTGPTPSSSNSAPTTCCAGSIPQVTRRALDEIVRRLTRAPHRGAARRHARRSQSRASTTCRRFEAIYPELAAKYDVLLYPFFLDGVAGDAKLNQRDGLHPDRRRRRRDRGRHPAQGRGTGGPRARAARLVTRHVREIDFTK